VLLLNKLGVTALRKCLNIASRFFAINKKVCDKVAPHLPQAKSDIFGLYERIVAQYMNSRTGQVIVDVGGGRACVFAKYRHPAAEAKIIAVDKSEEALKSNVNVDEKVVANVLEKLPFGEEEIDLLVSRAVLEHLENLNDFIDNSKELCKAGGYHIHVFPSKFSPFALINQILPHALSQKVLYSIAPQSKGTCGFPAYYDNCYYTGFTRLLKKHGFEVVEVHLSYYQSPYFAFFLPLFLVSAVYEAFIRVLGVKDLAAYVLVVARKQ